MKIALDISQIVYEGTGVACYTRELVSALLQTDRKNDYLLLGYSLQQISKLERFYSNVRKYHPGVAKKFFLIPQTFLNYLWNKKHVFLLNHLIGNIDIFHSSDWLQPPVKAKKVTTVHDMIVYKFSKYSHPQIVTTQKRRMEWVKKECDLVIADSHATKEDIAEISGIDKTKIKVVYPGISPIFKKANPNKIEQVKKKYQLPDNFILSVGINEPRKNLNGVVSAFRIIKNKYGNTINKLKLVIAGKSGWADEIKEEPDTIKLGYVSEEELPVLYSCALLFVYPSFYEGFGLPVLEAMSCGCPVITSSRGSLKEVVDDSALTIEPENYNEIAEKIYILINDNSLRGELIKKGLNQVKKFTWQKTAKEVIKIYEGLK